MPLKCVPSVSVKSLVKVVNIKSCANLVNDFPQPPLHKNGFSPVCVCRWRLKSWALLKDSAHISHEKGRDGEAGYCAGILIV